MFNEISLEVHCNGSDTFLEIKTESETCSLTADELIRILERAKHISGNIKREIKLLIINGFKIKAATSSSGRHVRVGKAEKRGEKELVKLKKGHPAKLLFSKTEISFQRDEEISKLYPNKKDLERSHSVNVSAYGIDAA
jgi:hypothetical protein